MVDGETLDALLLSRKVSSDFRDFAERAGISVRALHDLRAGRIATPRRATVLALAAALRVSPARVRAAIEASRRHAGTS